MVIWFVDSANVFITAEVKKVQKKKKCYSVKCLSFGECKMKKSV